MMTRLLIRQDDEVVLCRKVLKLIITEVLHIHPKTHCLTNSTTYKDHTIVRRRFSYVEAEKLCKQLP